MEPTQFLKSVDALENSFIDRLRAAVSIVSVSAEAQHRNDTIKMAEWIKAQMESLGIATRLKSLGKEPGTALDLPPLVLGRYGNDSDKPTIMVYSHYDVQPATLQDGWNHDPWDLVQKDGVLQGRGTSDDKGPLLNWLNVIESFQHAGEEVPVNLLFCFEGMEESGSIGFRAALEDEATKFFSGADAVCITDTAWSTDTQPTLPRGLRGVLFYILSIQGAAKDAHSGLFGGSISEPMTDMVNLMASLVDSQGKLLIPGIYDAVLEPSPEELAAYESLPFTADDGVGGRMIHDDQVRTLLSKWRMPSLSLHRIENAASGAGATTSIPASLVGKFSIRTVPNMGASDTDRLVQEHMKSRFKELQSKNDFKIQCVHKSDWFFEEIDHWNYQAAVAATNHVWGVSPKVTCEGGSIPIALDIKQVLGKNVLLLPVGRPTDGIHSVNEKINRINYINAVKVYGIYMKEVADRWRRSVHGDQV